MSPDEEYAQIPGYGICKCFARGGFGHVFEGKSSFGNVAIKRIPIASIIQKNYQKYVDNEISIHKELNHPSIVRFIEGFHDGDFYYIITELCENDLERYIKSRPRKGLSHKEARQIFSDVVEGVAYLHSLEVIHRDLKAANIFLKRENGKLRAKIGDFGLSDDLSLQENDSFGQENKLKKTYVGTPYYMPPEVHQRKLYGLKADIWSLGMLLYHMLVGHIPNELQGCKEAKEIGDIVSTRKIDLSRVPADSSFDERERSLAQDLIGTMLQINPNQRTSLQDIRQHEWLRGQEHSSLSSRSYDSGNGSSNRSFPSSFSTSPRTASNVVERKRTLDPIIESGMGDSMARSIQNVNRSNIRRDPSVQNAPSASNAQSPHPLVPFNTKGLKPCREEFEKCNFAGTIMDSGEIVLEFIKFSEKTGVKLVKEVFRVTGDGQRIYRYWPENRLFEKTHSPPGIPDNGCKQYFFSVVFKDGPFPREIKELQDRYRHASTLVDLFKSKRPKRTVAFQGPVTGKARCYLMMNDPDPNVETVFSDHNIKMVHTSKQLLIRQQDHKGFVPYNLAAINTSLPENLRPYWEEHRKYREIVFNTDRFVTEQERLMSDGTSIISVRSPSDPETSFTSPQRGNGPPRLDGSPLQTDTFSRPQVGQSGTSQSWSRTHSSQHSSSAQHQQYLHSDPRTAYQSRGYETSHRPFDQGLAKVQSNDRWAQPQQYGY